MPATDTERSRLRRKTGDNDTSLSDAEIDALFDEAEAEYSEYDRLIQFWGAVVERKRELKAAAAADVTYDQGDKSERLSDLYKHAQKEFDDAQTKLERLIDKHEVESSQTVRILGARRRPRHRSKPWGG